MNTFKEDKQAETEAALIKQSDAVFERWLVKHPEIDYEAAKKMFQDYMDFRNPLSEADFDFAYGNIRDRIGKIPVPTPEETKAGLIDRICILISSSDGSGRDGKFSTLALNTERKKMAHWPLEQLTQRLEEIVRRQMLSAKPIAELHQIVKASRKYTDFPLLGKTIVRPGTIRAVPLDAAYLRQLDGWELKKMCGLYGVDQVNGRLAGRN